MIIIILLFALSNAHDIPEQSEIDWSTCSKSEQCYALGRCFKTDNKNEVHDFKRYLHEVKDSSVLTTGKCEVGVHVKMFTTEFMHIQVQFDDQKFNASTDFSEVMFHYGKTKLFGCSKIGNDVTIVGNGDLVSDHMIELFEGQSRDLSFCSFTLRRVTAFKNWISKKEGAGQQTSVHYETKQGPKKIRYGNNDIIIKDDRYNNQEATHCDPTSIRDTSTMSINTIHVNGDSVEKFNFMGPITRIIGKNRDQLTCSKEGQRFMCLRDAHSLKHIPGSTGDLDRIECDRRFHLWKLVEKDGTIEVLANPKRYSCFCMKSDDERCEEAPKCSTEQGSNVICPISKVEEKGQEPSLTCDYDNPMYQPGDEKTLMIDNVNASTLHRQPPPPAPPSPYSDRRKRDNDESVSNTNILLTYPDDEDHWINDIIKCENNGVGGSRFVSLLTDDGSQPLDGRVYCNTGKYDCRYTSKLVYSDRDSCKTACALCKNNSHFGKLNITAEKLTCKDQANYDLRVVSLNGEILSANEYSCDIKTGLWNDKDGKNISERSQVMCLPKNTPHKANV